jgi:quercetin dioxygenase-like cupin family protein
MDRRSFVLKAATAATALPISALLFESALARADESTGWLDAPGTGGAIQFKPLWTDGQVDANGQPIGASGLLLKFAPNLPTPAHTHPEGEYAFIIAGEVSNEGLTDGQGVEVLGPRTYKAGEHGYAAPGTVHLKGLTGPEGATLFTFTPKPIVFIG